MDAQAHVAPPRLIQEESRQPLAKNRTRARLSQVSKTSDVVELGQSHVHSTVEYARLMSYSIKKSI